MGRIPENLFYLWVPAAQEILCTNEYTSKLDKGKFYFIDVFETYVILYRVFGACVRTEGRRRIDSISKGST